MKTLIKIFNWLKSLFTSKEKKLDNLIDEMNDQIWQKLEKKRKDQQALMDEIKANWLEITGFHYGSKFIPKTKISREKIFIKLNTVYFFKMEKLDIYLTKDLQLKCK